MERMVEGKNLIRGIGKKFIFGFKKTMGAGYFLKLQANLKDKVFKPGIPQIPENSENFKKWLEREKQIQLDPRTKPKLH
jgi:hypothetical protein